MRKLTGKCSVEGCESTKLVSRQMCKKHYSRWWKRGSTDPINAEKGTGWVCEDGYRRMCRNRRVMYEHVFLAEVALGKCLPPKAVVHHMNGNKLDNYTPFNLVICPDQAYHKLLHKRADEQKKYGRCFNV